MNPAIKGARQGILSLTIKDKGALYAAYMPYVKNGGLVHPHQQGLSARRRSLHVADPDGRDRETAGRGQDRLDYPKGRARQSCGRVSACNSAIRMAAMPAVRSKPISPARYRPSARPTRCSRGHWPSVTDLTSSHAGGSCNSFDLISNTSITSRRRHWPSRCISSSIRTRSL